MSLCQCPKLPWSLWLENSWQLWHQVWLVAQVFPRPKCDWMFETRRHDSTFLIAGEERRFGGRPRIFQLMVVSFHPEFEPIYHLWGVHTEKHFGMLDLSFFSPYSHTDTPRSFRIFFVSQIIIRMFQVADHDEEDSIDRVIRTWPGPSYLQKLAWKTPSKRLGSI